MKFLILSMGLLFSIVSFAKGLQIDIGKAGSRQSTVAIMNVAGVSKINKTRLISQIKKNLGFSTYFKFVENAEVKKLAGNITAAQAEKIRIQGVEFLIAPSTASQPNKQLVQFKVYLLKGLKLALNKTYTTTDLRGITIANRFSDDFMKALTGKKSIYSTKIAVTSDKVGYGWKEIYVMNWDGSNTTRVSYHKASALSPDWSPGGSQIVYSAITVQPKSRTRNANLYIYDFRTKRRSLLSSRPGINSGGTFFPDGKSLLMTLTQSGVPDLFKIGLDGRILGRLTKGPGRTMNVEPDVSPDGKRIAFSSDKSGRPMLYTMDLKNKVPKRLTIAGRYNSAPDWSPDGKQLVFAGWDKGHFDIFTMNADGSNLKRMTEKRKSTGKWSNNESPSYSPDGRFISFISNRTGKKELYIIRSSGGEPIQITNDKHNYYHAKWSPYLN